MRQNFNKKILPALLPALLLGLAARAAAQPPPASRARWVMGTALEIAAGPAAESAVEAAFREVDRLDRLLSIYKEDSEVSRLNRSAGKSPFRCSAALWEAVNLSRRHHELSRGAFDPTVPAGLRHLVLDPGERTVFFKKPGMRLDFGGIGKGLALDKAAAALKARGVESALLNFGGQILAVGADPGGKGWTVEVPGGPNLLITDASVSTSGNSERDSHITSPLTGLPISGRGPVTVVARTGAEADAWSTALFVDLELPYDGCVLLDGRPRNEAACRPFLDNRRKGEF